MKDEIFKFIALIKLQLCKIFKKLISEVSVNNTEHNRGTAAAC